MKHILFLCTGNSCRSQMAEGWTRHLHADTIDAQSAGTTPKGLDPRAVRVMSEAGVDIGTQISKTVDQLPRYQYDVVFTVCADAHERCPTLPGADRIEHVGFEDPPRLAQNAPSEEEALAIYRHVRDEIRAFVERLPERLG